MFCLLGIAYTLKFPPLLCITYLINEGLLVVLLDTSLERLKQPCTPKLLIRRNLKLPLVHSIWMTQRQIQDFFFLVGCALSAQNFPYVGVALPRVGPETGGMLMTVKWCTSFSGLSYQSTTDWVGGLNRGFYCITVLEAGRPKSRDQQGRFLLGEDLF